MVIVPAPRLPLSLHMVPFIINGGGVSVQSGPAGDIHFAWDAELERICFAGRPGSGSMSVDLLLGDAMEFPDNQESMVGLGVVPEIIDAQYAEFEDFTGWTTTHFDAGTMLSLNVLDATGFDFVTVELIVRAL